MKVAVYLNKCPLESSYLDNSQEETQSIATIVTIVAREQNIQEKEWRISSLKGSNRKCYDSDFSLLHCLSPSIEPHLSEAYFAMSEHKQRCCFYRVHRVKNRKNPKMEQMSKKHRGVMKNMGVF